MPGVLCFGATSPHYGFEKTCEWLLGENNRRRKGCQKKAKTTAIFFASKIGFVGTIDFLEVSSLRFHSFFSPSIVTLVVIDCKKWCRHQTSTAFCHIFRPSRVRSLKEQEWILFCGWLSEFRKERIQHIQTWLLQCTCFFLLSRFP